MSAQYISWGSITQGLTGVASKRKVRRQAQRQGQRQDRKMQRLVESQMESQEKQPKPAPIRYSAQNYDDYYDDTYDDSCCSHSGCSEQPYDHDFFGMCVRRYGVYHGSKKQSKQSAHSTKPKASGKDVYRLAKNSLIS
jgi:hypothetical protein